MGRKQKANMSKVSSVTPQPNAMANIRNEKLQKSEPPAKRKKLAQELDEEISDSEFDAQLDKLRAEQMELKGKKFVGLKKSSDEDNLEGDSEDEEEDSEDVDSDEEDGDDDDDESDEEHVERENKDVDSNDGEDDKDADSDDDDEDSDTENDEGSDKDDDDVIANEDQDSGEDCNDDSHMESEDTSATKSVTMSQQKKTKPALKDKKTLFLKNLPKSVTADMIRSFSSDVLEVRLQLCKAKKSRHLKCAFVEFSDEETAVKNKTNFERKKIEDHEISVDFVGEKSTFWPKSYNSQLQ